MKILACLVLLFASAITFGQNVQKSNKTRIHFSCSCDDVVGSRYATALRDLIASSPRYELAASAEIKPNNAKEPTTYNWQLSVVSVDLDQPAAGHATALSVVLLIGNTFYWTNWVQTCGAHATSDCAAMTLADIDNQLNNAK